MHPGILCFWQGFISGVCIVTAFASFFVHLNALAAIMSFLALLFFMLGAARAENLRSFDD